MSDWPSRRIHFIGIGGAGMSGLAAVCAQLGAAVSGSDRTASSYTERLGQAGISVTIGHDADRLDPAAEIIVSTAIAEDNLELALARQRQQPTRHRGELLAELCGEKRLIAVAGTHGKTTTTAMLAWALRRLGADPAYFIGGELPGTEGPATNAGWGEGPWVVAEADESDGSFLQLQPEIAIVTNIELDHHSRWSSLAELRRAFAQFCDGADTVVAGEGVDVMLRTGGLESPDPLPTARWSGAGKLELAVPGEHNRANAAAAIAALEAAGFNRGDSAAALSDFPGVKRRLELKGRSNGAAVYDDYAHHPTEVRAALSALRGLDPSRLIAIFQPHLYSRTKAMAAEFGAALALADEIGVLEVYPAREQPVGELAGVSGLAVAEAAADRAGGRAVWWLVDADRALSAFKDRIGSGDILVTLGAGDITGLSDRLVA